MSESVGIIVVNIDDSQAKEQSAERNSSETEIWNNCIFSEFPIIEMNTEDGIATCLIGQPHFGYTMKAEVDDNNLLNGEAKIYDSDGQLCAFFYCDEGEETGECRLYYDSGELYFDGYLEKGYRNGCGLEYSKNGKVLFHGFYKDGKRNPKIEKNKKHRKFWNEVDDFGRILCICRKNYRGLNDGICYFYENEKIRSISRWKDGVEIEVLTKFDGNDMIVFQNGHQVYKGPYAKLSDIKYITTGKKNDIHIN